ncbi:UDP-glucuronosyltransferase 1-2 [Labeo rohita]|uniref:UDP-glucuronosyltransferase 1-2 n=1 Tax=Labeo rohita TaxID=84645 RepID=A0ABQ8MBR4_LABRO|nr:UDP-glucuronosyltransferase 1-2 [Labeo rohita]
MHPALGGLDAIVQTWLRFHLYAFPFCSGESVPGRGVSFASSPILDGPSMVLRPGDPSQWLSIRDSHQEEPPLSGKGLHLSSPPGVMETLRMAPEELRLLRPYSSPELPLRGNLLEFLEEQFSTGLSHSTLKVLRPPACSRVSSWDLAVILEALSKPPFEPLDEVSEKFHTVKTVFLLAISSLKRVSDLQALSMAPFFLEFP